MESKKIRDLIEAYSSIYESNCGSEMEEGGEKEEYKGKKKGKKEKEEKDEKEEEMKEEAEQIDEADSIAAMRERAAKRRKQRYGASDTSRGGRDDYRPYTKADYERGEANDPRKKTNEEVDIFDTILEHLVAEGYADTNKAALAIMANMSEEWKQSILLELTPLGVKAAGAVDDQRRGSTRDKDLKDTRDALDKMKAYPNGFPAVKGV